MEASEITEHEAEPTVSRLKEHFCTITPLSKYLALVLFVTLPFMGFYFGVQYGERSIAAESKQLPQPIDHAVEKASNGVAKKADVVSILDSPTQGVAEQATSSSELLITSTTTFSVGKLSFTVSPGLTVKEAEVSRQGRIFTEVYDGFGGALTVSEVDPDTYFFNVAVDYGEFAYIANQNSWANIDSSFPDPSSGEVYSRENPELFCGGSKLGDDIHVMVFGTADMCFQVENYLIVTEEEEMYEVTVDNATSCEGEWRELYELRQILSTLTLEGVTAKDFSCQE